MSATLTNAQKIGRWREEHPGERLDARIVRDVLDLSSLRGADLQYSNLRGADLQYSNLRDANLQYSNLRGADLWGAILWHANLRGADLWHANLWDANLRGADLWRGLRVDGLPSGQVTMLPTPNGWVLRVGCWTGTPETLRELIAGDGGWHEARGKVCAARRPGLEALIAMCEAHMVTHAGVIESLAEKWGTDRIAREVQGA